MAITISTDRLDGLGGRTIANIYARIQSVTVKNYDTGGGNNGTDPVFKLLYDVHLFGSASIRNATGESPTWPNRMPSREIDHFTCDVTLVNMNANGANCYILAYADLKIKLANTTEVDQAGNSRTIAPIATNIADAI